MIQYSSALIALVLGLSPLALGQAHLGEIATIDLSATASPGAAYIGSNPTAVAWNGTDLYVAGFNNSGATANVALIQIRGALASPSFGTPFGVRSAPSLRGYTGLDIDATTLVASFDPGSSNPDGISAYDLNGNPLWSKNGRGGSGVGIDPGLPGGTPALGSGVGWTSFGSGRRALQDLPTGADIWTSSNGMIILTPEGTFWRDMDFDDDTGDIWLREGNNLIAGARTGDNAVGGMRVVVDASPDADFIMGQNVAYVDNDRQDMVIYNDRPNAGPGQSFANAVKAVYPDGRTMTLDVGAFAPPTGSAYYDFSWDRGSETLALLDFTTRKVHIFSVLVDPFYAYGSGCAGSGSFVPALAMSGDATPGVGQLTLGISSAAPAPNVAILLVGLGQAAVPIGGSGCFLNITGVQPWFVGPLALSGVNPGEGTAQVSLPVPFGTAGAELSFQAFCSDPGLIEFFTTTNGIQLRIS